MKLRVSIKTTEPIIWTKIGTNFFVKNANFVPIFVKSVNLVNFVNGR